ncbi:MAG: MarR family transcriptional regulator [Solirubrobacteraceae bacterium MAG38_C4-C5]|nr:MarR family transcriptional regulator [Candidatus Siliceabacter maunaloa]
MPARSTEAPPSGPPERLSRLPSWLINHLTGRANRLVAARLGRAGLRTDYALLASLQEFGPLSQAELGRRLAIDRSDMVAWLNRLEGQGLIRRAPNPDDRRRNAITITAAGTRALDRLEKLVEEAQDDLLEPLSAAQRAELVTLLQQLLDFHHQRPPPPADSKR